MKAGGIRIPAGVLIPSGWMATATAVALRATLERARFGPGPERAALEQLVADLAAAGRATHTAAVSPPGSAEAVAAADLSPSRRDEVGTKEAAAMLGISERRVRQLHDDRQLAAVKVGGRLRFDVLDVAVLIEARQRQESCDG